MNTVKLSLLFVMLALVLAACGGSGSLEISSETPNVVLICSDTPECSSINDILTEIVAPYGEDVTYVYGDIEGNGSAFAEERGIQAFPTTLVIGADGTELFNVQGLVERELLETVIPAMIDS
jgi:hypothetical protein